jgi:phosphatidylinositol glycan class O
MEDNLISSLRSANRSTVFVGDDTWKMLYPEKFLRSYFYPSLDVADLDTVDFGVYENVPKELQKDDWDLLIGHLLGVDHCGHTYGPYTDHIKYKLSEIDEFIHNMTESIDDDTLLLAFGDHGMTVTGDHGGESSDETDAALFAFSKRGFLPPKAEPKINQIDLTSTITLLLDAPIPFGSLGTPITELFNAGTEFKEYQILQKAYQQTLQYLNEYANIQSNFLSLFRITENDFESSESLRAYLERMRRVLRQQWTKFNLFFMTTGLLFSCLLCTVIFFTSFYGSNLSAHQFVLASILGKLQSFFLSRNFLFSCVINVELVYYHGRPNHSILCSISHNSSMR